MLCIFPFHFNKFYESIFFQVKMKISRSLKWTRTASMRSRKLARDMLLFWKRIDKEMVFFYLLLKLIDFMVQIIKLCLGGHCILS